MPIRLSQSRWPVCMAALVLACAVPAAWAAAPVASGQQPPAPAGAPTEAYTVKPGDVLSIAVWKEPDLQGPVLVRPDGSFSFPLAGQIDARNRTVALHLQGPRGAT